MSRRTGRFTLHSSRLARRRDVSAASTPTCRTSLPEPRSGAKSDKRSYPGTTAGYLSRQTTPRSTRGGLHTFLRTKTSAMRLPWERTFIFTPVSYTHLRAHETRHDLVCRLLLEKKKK